MTTTAPTRTAPATHATGRDSVTTHRSATSADNIRARRHHALRPLFGLVVRGVTDRAWLWFLLIGVALGAFTAIIDADVFLTDVNLADRQGVTPLQHARERGQQRIVELLLAHDAH